MNKIIRKDRFGFGEFYVDFLNPSAIFREFLAVCLNFRVVPRGFSQFFTILPAQVLRFTLFCVAQHQQTQISKILTFRLIHECKHRSCSSLFGSGIQRGRVRAIFPSGNVFLEENRAPRSQSMNASFCLAECSGGNVLSRPMKIPPPRKNILETTSSADN